MSEEQIRSYIIDKDSYDKNILVEAGAGAGKTRLIIQRVIGQIGAGSAYNFHQRCCKRAL